MLDFHIYTIYLAFHIYIYMHIYINYADFWWIVKDLINDHGKRQVANTKPDCTDKILYMYINFIIYPIIKTSMKHNYFITIFYKEKTMENLVMGFMGEGRWDFLKKR